MKTHRNLTTAVINTTDWLKHKTENYSTMFINQYWSIMSLKNYRAVHSVQWSEKAGFIGDTHTNTRTLTQCVSACGGRAWPDLWCFVHPSSPSACKSNQFTHTQSHRSRCSEGLTTQSQDLIHHNRQKRRNTEDTQSARQRTSRVTFALVDKHKATETCSRGETHKHSSHPKHTKSQHTQLFSH